MRLPTSPMVDGRTDAPLLVVALAPGREELREGRPLVGSSGRMLWSLAKRAGFTREDCLLLNTIGEWPEKADGNPSQEQLDKYWDAFEEAALAWNGRVVLCLGGSAFDRYTGILSFERRIKRRSGIEVWRGYLVSSNECHPRERRVNQLVPYKSTQKKFKGKKYEKMVKVIAQPPITEGVEWIIPTLHPSSVMRSGLKTIPALQADLHRVGRAVHGSLQQRQVVWDMAPKSLSGDVVCDIETPADPLQNNIILRVGMAADDGCWTSVWNAQAREVVKDVLGRPEGAKIFHNRAFDQPRLEAFGIEVAGVKRDTMLAAALLQPDLYKGLNAVASLYLDTPKWKHLADDDPAKYNAWDCAKTLEVDRAICRELDHTGQKDLFEKIIMPGSDALMRMSQRGIKLDEQKREGWQKELGAQAREAETTWLGISGGVNPRAARKVREWLDARDVPRLDASYNRTGGTTTDSSSLKEILRWNSDQSHPSDEITSGVTSLLRWKESFKLLSTYTSYPLDREGCIHPSYLPAAKDDDGQDLGKGLAGTWRITCRQPNLQNVPPLARKMFIPHSKDCVFIEADFSQIELRIAAGLSEDNALYTDLQLADPFARLSEELGVKRVVAKGCIYGSLFGAGPKKLCTLLKAQGVEITERETKSLQEGLASQYPKLWAWRQRVVEVARAQFFLTNPFGLRRYFYAPGSDAPAAIDFMPQSTAAIIMWQTLSELWEPLKELDAHIVNTIHDAVLVECDKGKVGKVKKVIKEVMERERPEVAKGWRVPVKIKIGGDWGSVHTDEND